MSYLSRPRIGFVAHDAMTNPSTANNENVVHLLDYDHVRLLNPPMATGPALPAMSHAAYREWMTTMIPYSDPFDPKLAPGTPPPSPTQPGGADWQPGMPGYWNYWGDHLTTFGSAAINSVWVGDDPVTDPAADALIGSRVLYNARIVDVDPADTFTTQFVCARFSVLGHDRSGQPSELVAGVLTTSFTRFLNFFRPRGAGSFQAVIPLAGLAFIADTEAPESPGFRALRDGCRAAGGLLVRHCLYAMKAAKKMPEMYERFQQNDPASNPKIGSVVGSIGVWRDGDLPASPVGRLLHQPGLPFFGTGASEDEQAPQRRVKTHEDVEKVSTTVVAAAATPDVTAIGPAVAVVDDGAEGGPVVALDLLTTFPETGAPPDPLAKVDYGPAALILVEGDDTTKVGEVRYDRTTYEQRAGVWEVPVPPGLRDRLGGGSLALAATLPGDQGQQVLLQEIACAQIESEQLATYLDLAPTGDGGGVAATATIRLRAFVKGEPAEGEMPVIVQRFHDLQVPGEVNSLSPLVLTATQLTEEAVGDVEHVVIPVGGVLDLPIEATTPGCFKLRFLPAGIAAEPSTPPNFAVEFFASFRALPHHDYSHLTDDEITWHFVYEEVFAYYSILYPIMGSIIPWGPSNVPSDPERVGQFASLIRQAVDTSRLDTALQMPITRELSAGKRALVQRWCDLQLRTT